MDHAPGRRNPERNRNPPGFLIDTITIRFETGAPADAPFLDGHFPGDPIVPGAVLLGYAASALQARGIDIASVQRMKFQRPLRPGIPFEIETSGTLDRATLVWRSGEITIAQARCALESLDG